MKAMTVFFRRGFLFFTLILLVACGGGKSEGNPTSQKSTSIEKIANYAKNGKSIPSIEDYVAAGVEGVNVGNIDKINAVVLNLKYSDVDTKEELQVIADSLGLVLPDTTAPTIMLEGANPVSLSVGTGYIDAGATASDDKDGDITANIVTVSNVDISQSGNYSVKYNVTDAANNHASEVIRTVIVTDTVVQNNTAPIAQAGSNQSAIEDTSITLDASASSDSDGNIVSYLWKEGVTTLSNSQSFSKSDFSVGSHDITLTVTDNNDATHTDTVLVTITKASSIVTVAHDGTGDFNCNGVNDHIEINKAIITASKLDSGTVHINAGTCVISKSIQLKSNITFEGAGQNLTTIKLVKNANWGILPDNHLGGSYFLYHDAEALLGSHGVIQNISLKDFAIDGNRDQQNYINSSGETVPVEGGNGNYTAIELGEKGVPHGSKSINISHVSVKNNTNDAILILDADVISIKNIFTSNIGHAAIYLVNVIDVLVEANKLELRADAGVRVDGGNHILIRNNDIKNGPVGGGFGIEIAHRYTEIIMNDVVIENNTIERLNYAGIALYTDNPALTDGVVIRNNRIYQCGDLGVANESAGINIYNFNNTIIENNSLFNNFAGGIVFGVNPYYGIAGLTGTKSATVRNNIITNSQEFIIPKYGIDVKAYGVYVQDEDDTLVTAIYNNVWHNQTADYYGVIAGSGSISQDPLFVASETISQKGDSQVYPNIDLHLQSTAGHWNGTTWINDGSTSSSIDAGDSTSLFSFETTPNGGNINLGAYGNTVEASKSP